MTTVRSLILAFFLFSTATAAAQSTSTAPDGFIAGHLITNDNTKLEGYLKDNMRKKGEVVLLTPDGKKKNYTAATVNTVVLGDAAFTSIAGEFFKVIIGGNNMRLLQKASSTAGQVSYNGAEPVVSNGSEGAIGDYFFAINGTNTWVSKKNFTEKALTHCATCPSVVTGVNNKQYTYANLTEMVTAYNNCR